MRNVLIGLVIGIVFIFAMVSLAAAQRSEESTVEGLNGSKVCTTRLQLRHPQRCSNAGARETLTDLVIEGVYPEHPLPVTRVDPSLGDVPFSYVRSGRKKGTPLYNDLSNAIKGKGSYRKIDPGFVYFSWIDLVKQDGEVAYMIAPGVYVRGDGMSRLSALPSFHGVALSRTPDRPFAWVLGNVESREGAGSDQPKTGRWWFRYELVWVYDVEKIGDWNWYRVGPEDWIEQRLLGIVYPDPNRPEGIPDNRWISINLYEQTVAIYEEGELIYATLVSSGLQGWWTRPGVFQVFEKLESDFMGGSFEADRSDYYYLEDVPWILYFDEARALHGAYWHNGFGYPRSHGCVNLSLTDANWIFNWAQEGTWVYVFDPSGETPTDPAAYGAGGA
ncbi:MAG: L,D-transpeptidase family protein [Anaerolineales bacterium]|nr:L,D-transpeptidase family protein [Anaerolineales bacterium]